MIEKPIHFDLATVEAAFREHFAALIAQAAAHPRANPELMAANRAFAEVPVQMMLAFTASHNSGISIPAIMLAAMAALNNGLQLLEPAAAKQILEGAMEGFEGDPGAMSRKFAMPHTKGGNA